MFEKDGRDESTQDGGSYASGFVVKLFQMVQDAPDDVISWTPAGDAFRITDLDRLENETLPAFFRHQRFQSLVRQLNFYNFRKINRERTFWIYRHPLFHRDRPECLHLLRRRTCPGIDGRRTRHEGCSDRYETDGTLYGAHMDDFGSDTDTLNSAEPLTKKQKLSAKNARSRKPKSRNLFPPAVDDNPSDPDNNHSSNESSFHLQNSCFSSESPSQFIVSESESPGVESPVLSSDPDYFSGSQCCESNLLSKLSRKLEEHIKRASLAATSSRLGRRGGRRRIGVVTPPQPLHSDTMKYNALTYDDDEDWFPTSDEWFSSTESPCFMTYPSEDDNQQSSNHQESILVDSSDCSLSISTVLPDIVPVEYSIMDKNDRNRIMDKIHSWMKQFSFSTFDDRELLYSVLCFCLSTAPNDPLITDKAVTHMKLHGVLAQEFQRYKAALLGKDFSLLDKQLLPDNLFGRNSESMDTARTFKVFIVNCLRNITRDTDICKGVNLSRQEANLFQASVKIWVEGVLLSA